MGMAVISEDANHILRPIGGGENPLPSLWQGGKTPVVKEGNEVVVEETGKNVVEEFSVAPVIFDKGPKVTAVGQVTPALARQAQFDTQAGHFFQEEHSGSHLCRPARGHQAGGSPSDDNDLRFQGNSPPSALRTLRNE